MRSVVYRNLDKPFHVFGFAPVELVLLSFALVGGGELAESLHIPRAWSFLFTIILGLSFYWFRHAMGDFFGRRLVRFITLPTDLAPQLFTVARPQ